MNPIIAETKTAFDVPVTQDPATGRPGMWVSPPQHNWKLGGPGKGFILQDGAVHTWPTEHMKPTHKYMMAQADMASVPRVKKGTEFHIEPHGRVWQYNGGMTVMPGEAGHRSLDADDHRAIMQGAPDLWFGQPGDDPPVQADQFGHADSLLPREGAAPPTHACPKCGWHMRANGQAGYTNLNSYDTGYGQMSWTCDHCGLNLQPGTNRPRPVSQGYALPMQELEGFLGSVGKASEWDGKGQEPTITCPACGGDGDGPLQNGCDECQGFGEVAGQGLFHSAPTAERGRIMQHGLQTSRPGLNESWQGVADEQPEGVYMATDPQSVVDYGDTGDVWSIDPKYVKNAEPDSMWSMDNAYRAPHNIPPEALTLHQGPEDAWQPNYINPYQEESIKRQIQIPLDHPEWGIGKPSHVWGAYQPPPGVVDRQPPPAPANPQESQLWFNPGMRNPYPLPMNAYIEQGQGSGRSEPSWGRGWFHKPTQTLHTWPEFEGTHTGWGRRKWGDGYNSSDMHAIGISPQGEITDRDNNPKEFAKVAPLMQQADPRLTPRVGHPKMADNYQQDSRNWPDPTEPRAAKPPDPKGCTCHEGYKLDCPIHGLNADPDLAKLDHTWSVPENNAVGYPQDQPRNWTQAVSSLESVAAVAQLEELKQEMAKLAASIAKPENKPRKLVILRDESGKMASIEEVSAT